MRVFRLLKKGGISGKFHTGYCKEWIQNTFLSDPRLFTWLTTNLVYNIYNSQNKAYYQYAHDVVLTFIRRRFNVMDVVWRSKRRRMLTGLKLISDECISAVGYPPYCINPLTIAERNSKLRLVLDLRNINTYIDPLSLNRKSSRK